MVYSRPGTDDWWADRVACDSGCRWINVGYFYTMATVNYALNRVGVQATQGS